MAKIFLPFPLPLVVAGAGVGFDLKMDVASKLVLPRYQPLCARSVKLTSAIAKIFLPFPFPLVVAGAGVGFDLKMDVASKWVLPRYQPLCARSVKVVSAIAKTFLPFPFPLVVAGAGVGFDLKKAVASKRHPEEDSLVDGARSYRAVSYSINFVAFPLPFPLAAGAFSGTGFFLAEGDTCVSRVDGEQSFK